MMRNLSEYPITADEIYSLLSEYYSKATYYNDTDEIRFGDMTHHLLSALMKYINENDKHLSQWLEKENDTNR